jgi:hypothetical protein
VALSPPPRSSRGFWAKRKSERSDRNSEYIATIAEDSREAQRGCGRKIALAYVKETPFPIRRPRTGRPAVFPEY